MYLLQVHKSNTFILNIWLNISCEVVQADTTYKNDLILQGRSKEGLLDTCISINKCTSLGAITSTSTHKRCCHDFESAGKCFMFG